MISLLIELPSRLRLYVVDFQILCYCGTMCVTLSYNSIRFMQQFQSFYMVKEPILYNSLIISTYEIEKRKRVTIWLLLKFPGLP